MKGTKSGKVFCPEDRDLWLYDVLEGGQWTFELGCLKLKLNLKSSMTL